MKSFDPDKSTVVRLFIIISGQAVHQVGALPPLGPAGRGPQSAHLFQDLQLPGV